MRRVLLSSEKRRHATLECFEGLLYWNSHLEVIECALLYSLTARRPKVRYVVGRSAKNTAILKRLLPDRLFDAIIRGKMNPIGNGRADGNGRTRQAHPETPIAECPNTT